MTTADPNENWLKEAWRHARPFAVHTVWTLLIIAFTIAVGLAVNLAEHILGNNVKNVCQQIHFAEELLFETAVWVFGCSLANILLDVVCDIPTVGVIGRFVALCKRHGVVGRSRDYIVKYGAIGKSSMSIVMSRVVGMSSVSIKSSRAFIAKRFQRNLTHEIESTNGSVGLDNGETRPNPHHMDGSRRMIADKEESEQGEKK